MPRLNELQIELTPYNEAIDTTEYDLDRIIFDLDSQLETLSSKADTIDYLVSIGSGVLCGMLDILWVGEFCLKHGRNYASTEIDGFVVKTAKKLGFKSGDISSAVEFLEDMFPIPSDGNTANFGGGLQHHLRDFAHHPTIVGLMFSLLTQFTGKSYGTNVSGAFQVANVPERSKAFIGNDIPTKILKGTLIWFFHLVSDMAGSSSTAGKSGGTGIPGPLLSLAKELSAIPVFKNKKTGENSASLFLSKLFNGTLLAGHDDAGRIIKDTALRFDLRSELGLGIELGMQAIPVAANECIVRMFYFIRRLATEMRKHGISSFDEMKKISWCDVKPAGNPTISRMLLISAGVFTTIDIGAAVAGQKYWVAVNYIGVGRFAVAIGQDTAWCLKARDLRQIKQMYEDIKRFLYTRSDGKIYEKLGEAVAIDKFGLTVEQVEILYNLEYHKTLNDIQSTKAPINREAIKSLKQAWLEEWKSYISAGYPSFTQVEGAELHWYDEQSLIEKIEQNQPQDTWFRLMLLEAMLFEPYYTLSLEKDKKGQEAPSKKYKDLQGLINGYKEDSSDAYLDTLFSDTCYYPKGYIKRLRRCYDKVLRELNEVLKTVITSITITAIIAVAFVAAAGASAPAIAVALVGSNFAGLSGAALTSTCLAYLGGGAIAIGGAGMAGGTIVIVGGGTLLGVGLGMGVGGTVGAVSLLGKKSTILQSAKLLVSVREIFLNDEQNMAYSNSVYEKYVQNIMEIEKHTVELRLQADVASGNEKKELRFNIKKAEESTDVMKIAMKNMRKFIDAFQVGLAHE